MSDQEPGVEPTDGRVLDQLYRVIESRRGADRESSGTARLFHKGPRKIAQKLGEEAIEAVIEGIAGTPEDLAEESADLLYHLLVLWAARGLAPTKVWSALTKRRALSGVAEKAARQKD